MLHDGTHAVVVDPGDAAPVERALEEQGLQLAGILVTHWRSDHRADHADRADHFGGVDALRPRLQGPVWGPARECIAQPYTPLVEGDVLAVPGLRSARAVEPDHVALTAYESRYQALRKPDCPTLPSNIGQELQSYPFLRRTEPDVVAAAQAEGATGIDEVSVLAALRVWKNGYR